MKRTAYVIGLAAMLMAAASLAEDKARDPLAVRIVPTRTSEEGVRSICLYQPADHFVVVVTNQSNEPIRLWREWCSWGWDTLTFRVTDGNGKTTDVRKGDREWSANYPEATLLQPGDHMVFDVAFDQETWRDAPLPGKGNSREIRMKAVFRIPADEQTREHKVWTGELASPEAAYTISR